MSRTAAVAALTWLVAGLAPAQDFDVEFRRAVRSGDYARAQALLENPAVSPDAQDGRGYTALMFASEGDVPELVTLLVKAGANLDLQNNNGETALILATKRGRVDATRLLLMAGADTTIRDSEGRTALAWARERNRTYLAQIIGIASQPSVAKVILSEKPVVADWEHLEPPKVIEETPPLYTEAAFDRGVEGRVILRVIIRKDGTVGPIRIHQSLDSGLDSAAIDAVKTWKFEPATIDGEPINVLADIEVNFRLQQKIGSATGLPLSGTRGPNPMPSADRSA